MPDCVRPARRAAFIGDWLGSNAAGAKNSFIDRCRVRVAAIVSLPADLVLINIFFECCEVYDYMYDATKEEVRRGVSRVVVGVRKKQDAR